MHLQSQRFFASAFQHFVPGTRKRHQAPRLARLAAYIGVTTFFLFTNICTILEQKKGGHFQALVPARGGDAYCLALLWVFIMFTTSATYGLPAYQRPLEGERMALPSPWKIGE
jgi:hypothetical protein